MVLVGTLWCPAVLEFSVNPEIHPICDPRECITGSIGQHIICSLLSPKYGLASLGVSPFDDEKWRYFVESLCMATKPPAAVNCNDLRA